MTKPFIRANKRAWERFISFHTKKITCLFTLASEHISLKHTRHSIQVFEGIQYKRTLLTLFQHVLKKIPAKIVS